MFFCPPNTSHGKWKCVMCQNMCQDMCSIVYRTCLVDKITWNIEHELRSIKHFLCAIQYVLWSTHHVLRSIKHVNVHHRTFHMFYYPQNTSHGKWKCVMCPNMCLNMCQLSRSCLVDKITWIIEHELLSIKHFLCVPYNMLYNPVIMSKGA